jgi:hypothetical protein
MMRWSWHLGIAAVLAVSMASAADTALAHGVPEGDKAFIEQSIGFQLGPFVYLGAKHMVTGYDHLLFLVGVIFFLYHLKDVATYVTLFAVGHSVTLLTGVLAGTVVNAYLVDAVIGLSVTYKALDNLGLLRRWLGVQIDTRAAVFGFGLVHGFGLATKLQEFSLSPEGLVANIVAFNVGVEIGQFLALSAILIAMGYWRRTASFARHARASNLALAATGLALFAYQLAGYFGFGQEAP